jgi:hypothetical protein
MFALLGGVGASWIAQNATRNSVWNGALILSILFILVLIPVTSRYNRVNQRYNRLVETFCRDALIGVGRDAVVLLINVDTVTHGMMYIQDVDKHREDLLIISKGRGAPWYQEQMRDRRPDLDIPVYDGPNVFDRWPAMLLEKYQSDPGVYLSAPVVGYFQYPTGSVLNQKYGSLPSGFLFKAYEHSRELSPGEIVDWIDRNVFFWDHVWGPFTELSHIPDDPDLLALILNYLTYRQIFAEFAAMHGHWDTAIKSSYAVLDMNPGPWIANLNTLYARQGKRYVMSDMVERAKLITRKKLPPRPMF